MLIIFLQHKHLYSIKSPLNFVHWRKILYLILHVSHFLWSSPKLDLILWIPSERLLTRFDNELALNCALSISCNMQDKCFVISSLLLSILVMSFSIDTRKILYFSVFSEHSQKLICYLFQNYVAWTLLKMRKCDWHQFLLFHQVKRLGFPMKKERHFLTDQVKSYALNKWMGECSWQ